jgi:hypothetical protein
MACGRTLGFIDDNYEMWLQDQSDCGVWIRKVAQLEKIWIEGEYFSELKEGGYRKDAINRVKSILVRFVLEGELFEINAETINQILCEALEEFNMQRQLEEEQLRRKQEQQAIDDISARRIAIEKDLPPYLHYEQIFVAPPDANILLNDTRRAVDSSELFDALASGTDREIIVWDAERLTSALVSQIEHLGLDDLWLLSVGGAGDIATAMLKAELVESGVTCQDIGLSDLGDLDSEANLLIVDDVLKTGSTLQRFTRDNRINRNLYPNSWIATWCSAYYSNGYTAYGLNLLVGNGVITGFVYDGMGCGNGALPLNSVSTMLAGDLKAVEVKTSLDNRYFNGNLQSFLDNQ